MTLPIQSRCRTCLKAFEPEAVLAQFHADYQARVGWEFQGHQPAWVARFCSEGCRYEDVEARARVQNAAASQRRIDERKARRKE